MRLYKFGNLFALMQKGIHTFQRTKPESTYYVILSIVFPRSTTIVNQTHPQASAPFISKKTKKKKTLNYTHLSLQEINHIAVRHLIKHFTKYTWVGQKHLKRSVGSILTGGTGKWNIFGGQNISITSKDQWILPHPKQLQ